QLAEPSPLFKRREIKIGKPERRRGRVSNQTSAPPISRRQTLQAPGSEGEKTVLVINASSEMAKEMTMQISLRMPACSIMYAPTIEVAGWILHRRKIDLIVSSGILPDGSISKLQDELQGVELPPDLVVVGDMNLKSAEMLSHTGYEFAAIKRLGEEKQ